MAQEEIRDDVDIWLSETKAGESDAFDKIAKQYRPLIESCVCYFYGSIDNDELEQEALIALYRAACSYNPEINRVSFGLYAKICINNSLISLVRTHNRIEKKPAEQLEDHENTLGISDPSDDYISKESFEQLNEFVRECLSPYEYSVFRYYIEGYKIKEISQLLSKTERSVEGAVTRIRLKLRSSLRKYDL